MALPMNNNEAMLTALGRATNRFNMVEAKLGSIFVFLLEGVPNTMAGAIFYAPNNIETRIRVLDAALVARIENELILEAWSKIDGRLSRLKRTRNKLAHHTVGRISYRDKTETYLTPQFFDPAYKDAVPATGGPRGIKINEVNVFTDAAQRILRDLAAIQTAVNDWIHTEKQTEFWITRQENEAFAQMLREAWLQLGKLVGNENTDGHSLREKQLDALRHS